MGKKNEEYPNALPVIEIDNLAMARRIQILICKLSYDNRMIVPNFGGEIDDIFKLEEKIKKSMICQEVDYSKVNWDLPDAHIARELGITREAVRQARIRLEIPKPALFRVRMKSYRAEERLRESWKPTMTIKDVENLLGVSYANARRLLKKNKLLFKDRRKG